jgi:hypothetical protein
MGRRKRRKERGIRLLGKSQWWLVVGFEGGGNQIALGRALRVCLRVSGVTDWIFGF